MPEGVKNVISVNARAVFANLFDRWVKLWASLRRSWVWPSWRPGRPSLTSSPVWSWPGKVWETWPCPARWAATSSTSQWGERPRSPIFTVALQRLYNSSSLKNSLWPDRIYLRVENSVNCGIKLVTWVQKHSSILLLFSCRKFEGIHHFISTGHRPYRPETGEKYRFTCM